MAKQTKSKSPKEEILHRVHVLYLIFIALGIGIAIRLICIQLSSDAVEHNAKVMSDGIQREVEIPSHRGSILARNGEPLVMSGFRYHATFDFASEGMRNANNETFKKNADSLAKMLSRHFTREDAELHGYTFISPEEYFDTLITLRNEGKQRAYKLFPRPVTLDEWNMMVERFPIMNNNMGWVYDREHTDERITPYGELAYQIVGHNRMIINEKSRDTIYGSGIEREFDSYLAGSNGTAIEQQIAHGLWTRIDDERNSQPEDGYDVVTTIDVNLQRMATERLRQALEEHNASFGVAMVMEVATGNILCMVNLGSGKVRGTNYSEQVNNYALNTRMCPGSTFKLMSAMALVENCGYGLDNIVEIPRPVKLVGSKSVKDTHLITDKKDKPIVHISLRDGFAHSSNIYFAESIYESYKDNLKGFTDYLYSLGINSTVGLDAYGEVSGDLPEAGSREWFATHGGAKKSFPTLAYGYIVQLPPIHTLTLYNGVANNGHMVAPRIVDRIENKGEIIETMPVVTLIDKMCSDHTLDILDECLAAAASPDRISVFRNLPFKVGCKTGTAQIKGNFTSNALEDKQSMASGIDGKGYYLGSIVCTMPRQNPKYTVMVAVAKQQMGNNDPIYGVALSGKPASDIMAYIYTNDPSLHSPVEEVSPKYAPKNIKAGYSNDVKSVCTKLSNVNHDNDNGEEWGYAKIDAGGNATIEGYTIEDGCVPDVVGMSLTDALYLLEESGLTVAHTGMGAVKRQSIAAGTPIEPGSTIELILDMKGAKR